MSLRSASTYGKCCYFSATVLASQCWFQLLPSLCVTDISCILQLLDTPVFCRRRRPTVDISNLARGSESQLADPCVVCATEFFFYCICFQQLGCKLFRAVIMLIFTFSHVRSFLRETSPQGRIWSVNCSYLIWTSARKNRKKRKGWKIKRIHCWYIFSKGAGHLLLPPEVEMLHWSPISFGDMVVA